MSAAERASKASSTKQVNEWALQTNERMNVQASGPVLMSLLSAYLKHCATATLFTATTSTEHDLCGFCTGFRPNMAKQTQKFANGIISNSLVYLATGNLAHLS